MTGSP
ncbi:unnamed protein product [Linum tenue]